MRRDVTEARITGKKITEIWIKEAGIARTKIMEIWITETGTEKMDVFRICFGGANMAEKP